MGGWGQWGLQLAIGRRSYSHSAATVSKSSFLLLINLIMVLVIFTSFFEDNDDRS